MRHVWPEREAVVRAGAEVRVQGPAGVFDLARVAVKRVAELFGRQQSAPLALRRLGLD